MNSPYFAGAQLRALAGLMLWLAALPSYGLSMLPWEGVRSFQEVTTFDGKTRYASYLRPDRPAPGAPALFLLPYNHGTAPAMANLTEAGQLVRDYGIWVILPIAINGEWAHNPSRVGQADDVGFLASLIDHAVTTYGIDPHRIYMTGYSAGGNMSIRFACEHPEKIAAAANVGATMRKALADQCHPGLPVPIAFMQGTADDQVPYDPDDPLEPNDLMLRGAMSAPDAAKFWATTDHCAELPLRQNLPDLIDDGTSVYLDRYDACDAGAAVQLFTIVNGGHNWPGGLDFVPRIGLVTQDISATRELWNFFSRFSRP